MTKDEAQTHRGDWAAVTEKTKAVLEESRLFRNVYISDPHEGPEGEIAIEIGFGPAPAFFRVVAPTAETASAALYQLACDMVEMTPIARRPDAPETR
jgi:hypothetical protein